MATYEIEQTGSLWKVWIHKNGEVYDSASFDTEEEAEQHGKEMEGAKLDDCKVGDVIEVEIDET